MGWHSYTSNNTQVATVPEKEMLKKLTILLLVVCCQFHCVQATTQVKWTAGNSKHKDDPAATAPRSQKYWDENNIKRPDYAKTDYELGVERGGGIANSASSFSPFWILLIVVAAAFVGYQKWQNQAGERLDGGGSVFKRHLTAEETRNARLARFDENMKAE